MESLICFRRLTALYNVSSTKGIPMNTQKAAIACLFTLTGNVVADSAMACNGGQSHSSSASMQYGNAVTTVTAGKVTVSKDRQRVSGTIIVTVEGGVEIIIPYTLQYGTIGDGK